MRRIALPLSLFLFCISPTASAQTADEDGPGNARAILANPVRPTFTDNAYFIRSGELQLDTGYLASLFEGDVPTLHAVELGVIVGVGDLIEARLRWNLFDSWGDDTGIGDLGVGIKGGFFGGLGEHTALAGLFELQLPTGTDPFGIDKGIAMHGALVATQPWAPWRFDLQAGVYAHLFNEDPAVHLPLAFCVTWSPLDPLRVLAEVVERLDLADLSDSTTSVLAGVGYAITPVLVLDGSARVGLSQSLPDLQLGVGVTWLVAQLF
ncbi:MAG: transporter [Bradymonadales bacterium]|nr:transporter [Bradymonadales bacterium]